MSRQDRVWGQGRLYNFKDPWATKKKGPIEVALYIIRATNNFEVHVYQSSS
jgi:hypothetical protein